MHIFYLGDNAGSSAEYLKDCLLELEHSVEHHDSQSEVSDVPTNCEIIIVSDYPANKLTAEISNIITQRIQAGTRLIMIGGWDSFNGRGTNYYNHPLAQCLPVTLQAEDDRVNAHQGLILKKDDSLDLNIPIDWVTPPVICGYNAVESKPEATTLVWASPIQTNGLVISLLQPLPLIVKGTYGQGTVIACMTDLAPHWCGGLIDWGDERRQLPHVEVGDMYIEFIRLLLEIK